MEIFTADEGANLELMLKNEYVIGGLDQIKKGDFGNNFPKTFDLEEAKLLFPEYSSESKLIVMPNILGVYRRFLILIKKDGESEPVEKRLDLGVKAGFNVHPSLVQVGYNPKEFNREVISDFFGGDANRIRIVPYQELAKESEDFEEYSKLFAQRFVNRTNEKPLTAEEMQKIIDLSRKIVKTDGMTKPEYALMQIFH